MAVSVRLAPLGGWLGGLRFYRPGAGVIVLAQQEARMLNHDHLGTEHLLLGLIHEGQGAAAKALESLGISLEAARRQVGEIAGRGRRAPSGHIPFTTPAKMALERSLREALQLGQDYIGTEHVLLGLTGEDDRFGLLAYPDQFDALPRKHGPNIPEGRGHYLTGLPAQDIQHMQARLAWVIEPHGSRV